jgi:hypothetical protein
MNAREIIADIPIAPGQEFRELALQLRLILRYLADNARDAQLEDGSYLCDITSFVDWLKELAEAARAHARMGSLVTVQMDDAEARERSRLNVIRDSARRWERAGVCPRCEHVHQGSDQCGEPLRGGGVCRCEMEVPA